MGAGAPPPPRAFPADASPPPWPRSVLPRGTAQPLLHSAPPWTPPPPPAAPSPPRLADSTGFGRRNTSLAPAPCRV
eukprot:764850-Hanusia_phi.AAC.7